MAVGVTAAEPKGQASAPAADGTGLTRVLLDRPQVPVTLPKGAPQGPAPVELPVEGTMVVDRLSRLAREAKSPWSVLIFESESDRGDEMPRRALPSYLIEQMEPLAANSPAVRFRVSGETTIFRGHAYLLVTKATVVSPPRARATAKPTPAPAPKPPKPASRPATPASRPATGGAEPTSDDVRDTLLSEKVGRPIQVRLAPAEVPIAPSVAPGAGRPLADGRGGLIVDRLVRVLPEPAGQWWVARFEADNTLQEPPVRLLPCGTLEKAQTWRQRRRGAGQVFRLSGTVTWYRQKRYLLIRKLVPERGLGRF